MANRNVLMRTIPLISALMNRRPTLVRALRAILRRVVLGSFVNASDRWWRTAGFPLRYRAFWSNPTPPPLILSLSLSAVLISLCLSKTLGDSLLWVNRVKLFPNFGLTAQMKQMWYFQSAPHLLRPHQGPSCSVCIVLFSLSTSSIYAFILFHSFGLNKTEAKRNIPKSWAGKVARFCFACGQKVAPWSGQLSAQWFSAPQAGVMQRHSSQASSQAL